MRICIPIQFKAQGGGFYFLRNLENYLHRNEIIVHHDLETPFDVLFTTHWMTPRHSIIKGLRENPMARVVQRIDGAAQDYGRGPEADAQQASINELVDLTIFQSQYARHATRQKFQVVRQDGPVIYNPVDIELFTPIGPSLELGGDVRVACVTWSTNPLKGSAKIYATALANPMVDFFLCGNYPDAPMLDNLHVLGVLDRSNLARLLRSCHLLLTYSRNEACPNHVLEALSCGLPVLFWDSGAMSELIGDCGLPLNNINFYNQMQKLMNRHQEMSLKARQRALSNFHADMIFLQYLNEIKKVFERPPSLSLVKRQLLALSTIISRQGKND